MRHTFFLLLFLCVLCLYLHSTQAIFITQHPYSIPDSQTCFSRHIMQSLFCELGIDFSYQYVSFLEAMQMIDDELDVVIFPYTRPKMMSNRILLSDTLYTMHHHIFFDQRKDVANHISQLTDLRAYKVGSYPRHRGEPSLRLAGLTIHYSSGFDASFEKLLSGDIDFIVDEKIKVLHYISTLLDEDVSYIDFLPFQLFPDYFYAIAPVKNEAASAVISKLNDLIADEPFYKEMIDLYFEKLRR